MLGLFKKKNEEYYQKKESVLDSKLAKKRYEFEMKQEDKKNRMKYEERLAAKKKEISDLNKKTSRFAPVFEKAKKVGGGVKRVAGKAAKGAKKNAPKVQKFLGELGRRAQNASAYARGADPFGMNSGGKKSKSFDFDPWFGSSGKRQSTPKKKKKRSGQTIVIKVNR